MTKQDKNIDSEIHVINYKDQTIKPMSHFELCDFLNEMMKKEKKWLFTPNAEAAFFVLTSKECS